MMTTTSFGPAARSRRDFLASTVGMAALAASAGCGRSPSTDGQEDASAAEDLERREQPSSGITVRAVNAYHVYIDGRSDGVLDVPSFSSDDDPRRWRWGGPFEQLPSAIMAVIKTDQGITGFGMGAGGPAAVEIIHQHLRHLLIGADPRNVEQLWDQMYSSAIFYGRRGLFPMALSAVDNALWDIKGKHAGKTVHALLGGKPDDRVAVYQTGGSVAEGRERGIRHFKRGLRSDPRMPSAEMERSVEDILAARETMGPEGNLMTDSVSRGCTVERAIEFVERLLPAKLYFMEELLSPDDVFGYAELVKRVGGPGRGLTKIACGEHEYTQYGFDVLIRLQAAEILQPDVTWCGGLTAARRIAALVEQAGLEIIPHRGGSLWGLPIALTAPSCTMAESFPTGAPLPDAMRPPFENGDYLAPEGVGFGTTMTEELVVEHRIKPRSTR